PHGRLQRGRRRAGRRRVPRLHAPPPGAGAMSTVDRLRSTAGTLRGGWAPERWTRVSGPGPAESLPSPPRSLMDVGGAFPLTFTQPGSEYVMRTDLVLPE